jgi:hypothetical protein
MGVKHSAKVREMDLSELLYSGEDKKKGTVVLEGKAQY